MSEPTKLSPVEAVKVKSRGLRGTLTDGLQNEVTGALTHDDQTVIKFHGIYQQDDRDRREERERKKLERAYSYMIRLRIPGGDISAEQWRGIARVADATATGIVKITTRQTVQLHGVVKSVLKPTVQMFYDLGLDSIAACGDINRNVVAGAAPVVTPFYKEAHAFADAISKHLLPKTNAFCEIWLDGEKLAGDEPEEDPLYQKRYLPRKFKIAIAIPPHNDSDVLTNDIGLIAVEEKGMLTGFNVAVGGGMGTTHGNPETYPRLATIIRSAPKYLTLEVCWQIAAVQRDFGNRADRARARLKYTVDTMGVDGFRAELEKRLGFKLGPERPAALTTRADIYGWQKDSDGSYFCTLFVENGRIVDDEAQQMKTALRAIAETGLCRFRFTANQNIMLTRVAAKDKPALEKILKQHKVDHAQFSRTRQDALACVALNTCPLALAEGQRYLPALITKIETLLAKHRLSEQPISIRMTGCPNGCARPHTAEIGFVGRSMGRYNMHIGGDHLGLRLNRLYREDLDESGILETLDALLGRYAKERGKNEMFGDFVHRAVKFGAAA